MVNKRLALARCLIALALCGLCAAALGEEAVYVRNEYNFVEESMDISGGIPEDAPGRLGEIRRPHRRRRIVRVARGIGIRFTRQKRCGDNGPGFVWRQDRLWFECVRGGVVENAPP